MKLIFWCLILLNVVFGVLIATHRDTAPSALLQAELHPEHMKLLSPNELASFPMRSSTANDATVPNEGLVNMASTPLNAEQTLDLACYEWGSFNANASTQALNIAKQLNIKALINQQTAASQHTRYWIYHPPLDNLEAAQQTTETYKRLGVDDVFIVQDPQFKFAISFGVFRDERLADKLMTSLKAKGIQAVVKLRRLGGEGQTLLQLNQISVLQYQALKKTQPLFPDAELKQVDCAEQS